MEYGKNYMNMFKQKLKHQSYYFKINLLHLNSILEWVLSITFNIFLILYIQVETNTIPNILLEYNLFKLCNNLNK